MFDFTGILEGWSTSFFRHSIVQAVFTAIHCLMKTAEEFKKTLNDHFLYVHRDYEDIRREHEGMNNTVVLLYSLLFEKKVYEEVCSLVEKIGNKKSMHTS